MKNSLNWAPIQLSMCLWNDEACRWRHACEFMCLSKSYFSQANEGNNDDNYECLSAKDISKHHPIALFSHTLVVWVLWLPTTVNSLPWTLSRRSISVCVCWRGGHMLLVMHVINIPQNSLMISYFSLSLRNIRRSFPLQWIQFVHFDIWHGRSCQCTLSLDLSSVFRPAPNQNTFHTSSILLRFTGDKQFQ